MSFLFGLAALIGGIIGALIAFGVVVYGVDKLLRRLDAGREYWRSRGKPTLRLNVDAITRIARAEKRMRKAHVGYRGYNFFKYEYNYEWLGLRREVVAWCEMMDTPVPKILMRYPGDTKIAMVFERPDDAFAFKMRWL